MLLSRGYEVTALVRDPSRLDALRSLGARVEAWHLTPPSLLPALAHGALVLHSVPDIPDSERSVFRDYLTSLRPSRVVYLSTTGVYGRHEVVSASTPVDPFDEKSARRLDEEQFVQAGPWSSLILRPAAIYGPGRGVHIHIRNGREPRSQGGMVSRIHADDLARIAVEGLLSDCTGAWPVADDLPASSIEVAGFCRQLFGLDTPEAPPAQTFTIAGRRVDGTAIRERLGVTLHYPDYRAGIRACIEAEASA